MLENIAKIKQGVTHLITAENVYGAKGAGGKAIPFASAAEDVARIGQGGLTEYCAPARELGQGWKVRPCIYIPAAKTIPVMDVDCSGAITHIWMTYDAAFARDLILRFYWDDENEPSVEAPIGDFFCAPFRKKLLISSIPMAINPTNACNCYFPMPFRKHARITVENRNPELEAMLFYAISFEERAVAEDEAYFHAQFRRENPTSTERDYVILDGVRGEGQYVGTSLGWQQNSDGWWGEGEVKMYIDGDTDFASYVGTGTEDYFCGAWGFCKNFSSPFTGYQDLTHTEEGRETNRVGNRHAMYRFHLPDPIRFTKDLKVTIQALGWRSERRYLPLKDDICSVAYWYQAEPHNPFPAFSSRDAAESI